MVITRRKGLEKHGFFLRKERGEETPRFKTARPVEREELEGKYAKLKAEDKRNAVFTP